MSICTRVPHPDREVLYERAKHLIDVCLDTASLAKADLSVARAAAVASTKGYQAMVTQAVTDAAMAEPIRWKCPRCKLLLGYHDTQEKKVVFPEGVVDYRRGRYRCGQCGEEYVPADEINGLESTEYTLDAKEAIATKAAGESYRSVVDDVGPELAVCRQTVARVVSEVAGRHKQEQDETVGRCDFPKL